MKNYKIIENVFNILKYNIKENSLDFNIYDSLFYEIMKENKFNKFCKGSFYYDLRSKQLHNQSFYYHGQNIFLYNIVVVNKLDEQFMENFTNFQKVLDVKIKNNFKG